MVTSTKIDPNVCGCFVIVSYFRLALCVYANVCGYKKVTETAKHIFSHIKT